MKSHLPLLVLCLLGMPFSTNAQKEVCKSIYVWDFTDENGKKNNHTKLLTQEVEDALTATSCRVLQRRNYAKLSEQIDNENAVQTIEGMSGTISNELQSIKAETVLFGRVQMDFSGSIMLGLSFQNLLTKEILKSESLMLAGEDAHNLGKRKQKITDFISHCVGPKVISNEETSYWGQVQQLGTPEGYQTYLSRYPEGKYKSQATAALADELVWQDIRQDTRTGRKVRKLMKYTENQQHIHYQEARDQLESLLWKAEQYELYKSHFPDGKYAGQVNDLYEAKLYKDAVRSVHFGIPKYLASFPNGKYLSKLDDLLWGEVLEASTFFKSNPAKEYLKHFPSGKYAKEAKKIVENGNN